MGRRRALLQAERAVKRVCGGLLTSMTLHCPAVLASRCPAERAIGRAAGRRRTFHAGTRPLLVCTGSQGGDMTQSSWRASRRSSRTRPQHAPPEPWGPLSQCTSSSRLVARLGSTRSRRLSCTRPAPRLHRVVRTAPRSRVSLQRTSARSSCPPRRYVALRALPRRKFACNRQRCRAAR